MGLDLKADMHVRERRTGGRGMVLRFWRHHNGHVWAEVRFINGDTLTVRSTNLERVSLSDDEVEALSKFEALPADPLELLQRTIDRSVRVTADDGVELTNEFDEVLQADGTALTADDLSVNRRGDGRVVPEGGIDEEAALEASTRARAGRATTRTRQLVCRACDDDPASAVVTCDICVRRARGSRAEWRVSLNSNGVLDNGVLHKMRSHCGQFASVRRGAGKIPNFKGSPRRRRAPAADASDPEPAPKSTADKCFELAALLLEGGFVGKLPVARAADVRALSDTLALRRRGPRGRPLDAPSTRRFVGGVAPDADDDARRDREGAEAASRDAMDVEAFCAADAAGALRRARTPGAAWRAGALEAGGFEPGLRVEGPAIREPAPPPRKLGAEAPSASAAVPPRGRVVCSRALEPQREAAMENDVFTGRHRTRTTPDAVLDAGWTRHWDVVTDAVHHAQWAFERVVGTLRDTPAGWADAVREVLLDEYHQPFDDAVVYHPAHKLVLISMVAKGLHDVNVLKLPPPATYARAPDFRARARATTTLPGGAVRRVRVAPPPRQVEYMAPYGRGELAVPVDRGDCAPDGPDVAEAASALARRRRVLPPLPPDPASSPRPPTSRVRDLDVDAELDDAPPLAAAG
ncbi:hypothetical protein SO694_00007159 [Aureococcus anophagefferens]|uniref:Uncharacterized protein n=1 Tax=Aureococcus anophagefferens TaxID=44056 RepID=A0ABR1GAA7_AURAN